MSNRLNNPPLHFEAVTTTGNTQATAAAIPKLATPGFVTATGDNVTGLLLPIASKWKWIIIKNVGTNQLAGLYIYPQVGSAINLLGTNNPILLPMQTAAIFVADNSLTWHTCPVLPS